MKIALDFDETFTKDPDLWLKFISLARYSHNICIVTARDEGNDGINWGKVLLARVGGGQQFHNGQAGMDGPPCPVIWCDGRPKRTICRAMGWEPDVWIDDNPYGITNLSVMDEASLLAWRKQDKYRGSKLPIHGRSRGQIVKKDKANDSERGLSGVSGAGEQGHGVLSAGDYSFFNPPNRPGLKRASRA